MCPWCAGRAAALPTATTGATASARARTGPPAPTSGPTIPRPSHLGNDAVQLYETNAFGTDEFMRFCHLAGAQPYLASNLRSLPALEFARWVEYCNSPAGSTTLAKQRAANGSAEPYNVRYWGVGNESWGCGGNFEPGEYAEEFRRFTTWVPSYDVPLYVYRLRPERQQSRVDQWLLRGACAGRTTCRASFADGACTTTPGT